MRVVIVVAVVALLGSCDSELGSTDETRDVTTSTAATAPMSSPLVCLASEHVSDDGVNPPSCVSHDVASTVSAASSTASAASSTAVPPTPDIDQAVLQLGEVLVAEPQSLVDFILAATPAVGSVDPLDFEHDDNSSTPSLTVKITSTVTTPTERDDAAWAVASALANLWGDGAGFHNEVGTLHPGLNLVIDQSAYSVPMELMIRIFDVAVSKEEFLRLARQP